MSPATLNRATAGPSSAVAVAPTDLASAVSVGDDLPERNYFNGCSVSFDLPRYEAMVGPLTAAPDRSLADVVREVAGA